MDDNLKALFAIFAPIVAILLLEWLIITQN